jgi:hypothetical protein
MTLLIASMIAAFRHVQPACQFSPLTFRRLIIFTLAFIVRDYFHFFRHYLLLLAIFAADDTPIFIIPPYAATAFG